MACEMNTVNGFVTHFETKKPLPRLSVEVFSVDKFNVIPPIHDAPSSRGENIRLASGVTGTEGDLILSFLNVTRTAHIESRTGCRTPFLKLN